PRNWTSFWLAERTPTEQVNFAALSPDPRQQAIAHSALIRGIARQIPDEESLLIQQSPYQCGHDRGKDQHTPPRTERNRYAKQHHERGCIHRVSYQSVRAGR